MIRFNTLMPDAYMTVRSLRLKLHRFQSKHLQFERVVHDGLCSAKTFSLKALN